MRRIVIVTCGLLLAACASADNGEVEPTLDPQPPEQTLAPANAPVEEWSSTLSGQGEHTVTGEVVLRDAAEAGTYVAVEIGGGEAGATYPWHVHAGDCGSNGPIVGLAASYPPLVVGQDGAAMAEATIEAEIAEDGDYFVNVHASPTDLQTIVSCGEVGES